MFTYSKQIEIRSKKSKFKKNLPEICSSYENIDHFRDAGEKEVLFDQTLFLIWIFIGI